LFWHFDYLLEQDVSVLQRLPWEGGIWRKEEKKKLIEVVIEVIIVIIILTVPREASEGLTYVLFGDRTDPFKHSSLCVEQARVILGILLGIAPVCDGDDAIDVIESRSLERMG
jgi:hypothetical protein